MSKWRQIQRELMNKAIRGEKLGITQQNIAVGRIYGTVYRKPNVNYSKAVLLVHCLSTNRYAFGVLAERLVEYGILCLSIDLPSHYLNPNTFTLGEVSETITAGVLLIKKGLGIQRVAVIAHSIAAIGALFSNAGYNKEIEITLYGLWERIARLIAQQTAVVEGASLTSKQVTESRLQRLSLEIEEAYSQLKKVIFDSLAKGIREHSGVTCYIFLAAPLNLKNVIPGLRTFRVLPQQLRAVINSKPFKRMGEVLFLHHLSVWGGKKEGGQAEYKKEKEPDYSGYFHLYFFKTKEAYEFLKYFLTMKEPADFFKLIQDIMRFKHRDDKVSFFEYYMKKYLLPKPKLFIYGKRDIFLRPFLFSNRERLERFYNSWGEPDNIKIYYGQFSHIMMPNPKQQTGFLTIKDEAVTEQIMMFLDKYL